MLRQERPHFQIFFNLKERTYFTANATTQYELLIQVEKLFTIVLKKIILHIVYLCNIRVYISNFDSAYSSISLKLPLET